MARPVVGIIGNQHLINDQYPAHAGGSMNSEAVAQVADCVPLVVPADPRFVSVEELLEVCDGFLLTGGRPNVHPEEYGEAETEAHGAFDRARDAIALSLVRACVERGQPFLGICRGFQEVNVAMGGTLHPEIRDLLDHLLHTIACKAAIKAGDRLAAEEVTSLLEQRDLYQDTHHCPHGRPTALFFSRDELDRMFGRLGPRGRAKLPD